MSRLLNFALIALISSGQPIAAAEQSLPHTATAAPAPVAPAGDAALHEIPNLQVPSRLRNPLAWGVLGLGYIGFALAVRRRTNQVSA